jgi:hypothetical protein
MCNSRNGRQSPCDRYYKKIYVQKKDRDQMMLLHVDATANFFKRGMLPAKHVGKHQRRYNRSIAFDNVFWCVNVQFAPGDFFVGVRA